MNNPVFRFRRTLVALISASAIGIGIGYLAASSDLSDEPSTFQPASSASTPSASALAQSKAASGDTAAAGRVSESKFEAVERLLKSKDPSQAFEALKILNACARSQNAADESAKSWNPETRSRNIAQFGDPREKCASLLPSQLAQRPAIATQAAEAMVPGAYGQFIEIVNDNPHDTALQAAFARIVEKGLALADPTILMQQSMAYSNCADPPVCTGMDLYAALKYWTAYRAVRNITEADPLLDSYVKQLGVDRVRLAEEEGKKLVAEARRNK